MGECFYVSRLGVLPGNLNASCWMAKEGGGTLRLLSKGDNYIQHAFIGFQCVPRLHQDVRTGIQPEENTTCHPPRQKILASSSRHNEQVPESTLRKDRVSLSVPKNGHVRQSNLHDQGKTLRCNRPKKSRYVAHTLCP